MCVSVVLKFDRLWIFDLCYMTYFTDVVSMCSSKIDQKAECILENITPLTLNSQAECKHHNNCISFL